MHWDDPAVRKTPPATRARSVPICRVGLPPHHHSLPHRAFRSLPLGRGKGRSSSSGGLSLCSVPVWAGLELMGISALSWEPVLAWLPTPLPSSLGQSSPWVWESSSSQIQGSCTLGEILGWWSQQNQAIPGSAFPGHRDCLVPAPASPGQEGKWCQSHREQARAQLLGRGFPSSLQPS